jgi:hypothetical protein
VRHRERVGGLVAAHDGDRLQGALSGLGQLPPRIVGEAGDTLSAALLEVV